MINFFLGIRDDLWQLLRDYRNDTLDGADVVTLLEGYGFTQGTAAYRAALARLKAIVDSMVDTAVYDNFFFTQVIAGNTWHVISVIGIPEADVALWASYESRLIIGGAWYYDTGLQVGTEYDTDGETIIGTPTYPIHARLVDFMPNGVLEQVNKFAGQADRIYT